jgi:CheY-like chemotaxis protein
MNSFLAYASDGPARARDRRRGARGEIRSASAHVETRLRVECASNGHDALAAIARTTFALVSDIHMPSVTGVEFLAWLTDYHPELLEKTVL